MNPLTMMPSAPPPYYGPPPVAGGYGSPTPMQKTHPLSIASLVTGILSIVPSCCCLGFLGLPLAITGIITGILGLMKIKASPQTLKGNGLAIAGLICAGLGLVFGVLELVPGVMQQLQDAKSGAGAP